MALLKMKEAQTLMERAQKMDKLIAHKNTLQKKERQNKEYNFEFCML